jgi:hypothetical protein
LLFPRKICFFSLEALVSVFYLRKKPIQFIFTAKSFCFPSFILSCTIKREPRKAQQQQLSIYSTAQPDVLMETSEEKAFFLYFAQAQSG